MLVVRCGWVFAGGPIMSVAAGEFGSFGRCLRGKTACASLLGWLFHST